MKPTKAGEVSGSTGAVHAAPSFEGSSANFAVHAGYVIAFDQAKNDEYPAMGGKCASLAALIAAAAPVPPGFAVTTNAFWAMLEVDGLRDEINALTAQHDGDDVAAQADISRRIHQAFLRRPLPQDVVAAIRQAYRSLVVTGEGHLPVAVRSSGTIEDMPNASFAGQGDTYLWIVDEDSVVERVKACWASLYNARALAYRAQHRIGERDIAMAVAVQRMVDAEASGVVMTLDPTNGDRSKIIIEAAWGLGEPVVSGEVTPDQFVVDKILLAPVKRRISRKDIELVADPAIGKAIRRSVEADRQTKSSLTDEQIVTIARLAKDIERYLGQPQDIEWAVDRHAAAGAGIVLLQSRPETVWSKRRAAPSTPARTYSAGIEGIVSTLLSPVKIQKR